MQHKIELSTELLFLPFGCYHGIFNSDSFFDGYLIDQDFEDKYIDYNSEYFWDHFDNDVYMDAVKETISDYCVFTLAPQVCEFVEVSMDCVGYDSPKYYNYRDDHFHIDVEIDDDNYQKLYEIADNNREDFSDWLKEHYTSCDGFMSNTANNYKSWSKGMDEKNEQEIAAIFSFIIHNLSDYNQEDILCDAELFYSDFVNMETYNDFKDYLESECLFQENYENWQLRLIEESYPFKDEILPLYNFNSVETITNTLYKKYDWLGHTLISDKVKQVFNNIESHTLELAF